MANTYTASIGLRDHSEDISVLNYNLGEFDEGTPELNYVAAANALNQVRGALVDITECDLAFVRLTEQVQQFDTVPTHEDARNYVKATVVLHLNAPATTGKYHVINIPGPIDAMFLAEEGSVSHKIVDVTNALLQQYVQQLADHTFVSDGEQINTASGTNGIRSGRRTSRAQSRPTL